MKRELNRLCLCVVILAFVAATSSAQPGLELGIKGGLNLARLSSENVGFVSFTRSMESGLDYRDTYETNWRSGFQIGGFVALDLSDYLALQAELSYVTKGGKVEGEGVFSDSTAAWTQALDEQVKTAYLEIPILIKFKIPTGGRWKPSVFAGPAFALNLSARSDFKMDATAEGGDGFGALNWASESVISNEKRTDLVIVLGGDVKLEAGSVNIMLDLRYNLGTSELFENVSQDRMVYHPGSGGPTHFPMANWNTGEASDLKNRAFSIMLGVSVPL